MHNESFVTTPLITQCLARFFFSWVQLSSHPLLKKVLVCSNQTPFSISSVCFFSKLRNLALFTKYFLISLGGMTLQSNKVSPAMKATQPGHCTSASLSSQQTAQAGPQTKFQDPASNICLLHILNMWTFHLPSHHDLARQHVAEKASSYSSSALLSSMQIIQQRTFLHTEQLCYLPPDP